MTLKLGNIKTYLLTKYPSFDNGYANVSKPNGTDLIVDEAAQEIVSLDDTKGNFFYIRSLKLKNLSPGNRGTRIRFYDRTTQCRIVALSLEASEDDLENILITAISAEGCRVTRIDTERTRVFKEETGADLTRKEYTIVAADFEVTDLVSAKNCSLDPCNC